MRWAGVIVAGACLLVACSGPAGDPRPKVFRAESSSAIYEAIVSREVDPEPLAADEVFAKEELSFGAVKMRRGRPSVSANCAEAVWGSPPLQGCTQVLRAVYSADGVSGQFAIFNLPDSGAADRLVQAFRQDAFLRPAPGQPAIDGGSAQGRALGHYAVVSWVAAVGDEKPDLTDPLLAVDSVSQFLQTRLLRAG
ncbi:hypothetical protein Aph01nite_46710 [Acrocarpospora phusangensis]|uniref:Lipoprotein n=1 Tax=Acrocarpospora phusangensis TaxID=1070424 RepID=A0A919QEA4_9ACTN|nr:hypothetical protein [Acrocarpospora phusangensis]GIH26361.1 hypothetical protein Aph01nite_46710 [Acrocarpospora phusangensis]